MAEENKVLVPPFSKKEVKIIAAVEGVNEGIQDGKVNIPAGGTKLYQHVCDFGGGIIDLTFISTSSEPITNNDSVQKLYGLAIPKCSGTLIGYMTGRYDNKLAAGATLTLYTIYDKDNAYREQEIGTITDTITEL